MRTAKYKDVLKEILKDILNVFLLHLFMGAEELYHSSIALCVFNCSDTGNTLYHECCWKEKKVFEKLYK